VVDCPSMLTLPWVGTSMQPIRFKKVDFPNHCYP
jgi:hypothetical protein